MKKIILFIFLITVFLSAQQITFRGQVFDSQTLASLPNANIKVLNKSIGAISNNNGEFLITSNFNKNFTLVISYIGYSTLKVKVDYRNNSHKIIAKLVPKVLPSQSILVEASVGKKGFTPFTYSKIKREKIEDDYTFQDIPEYLSSLPSTTFYSENGNGIGYNYLSIRGFDQRRISVSINGIPQNDPEDNNVYWLDFPDLLESTELIQVQRGAGSGVTGYPAIGGSINIITATFSNKPFQKYETSFGSFNTRKYSASFSSGLINNKYSVYAKLSKTLSSGYRNSSWTNFNSYYFSAVRYDKNLTTQINFYGGPISDGLAYTGLPKFTIKDKNLRKGNFSFWSASNNKYTFTKVRRPSEIENFSQPHYEILNELKLSDKIKFNSALFLIVGNGFFKFDASWADTTYLRLTNNNGFSPAMNPGNTLIKAQIENTQFGWVPRISIRQKRGQLVIGGEIRIHKSDHWGSIDFAENLPKNVTKDFRYYFYKGQKDIINGFVHKTYKINKQFNLLGEVQIAYYKYKFSEERFLNNQFEVSNTFVNPRFGINYRLNKNQSFYFSFSRVSREPRAINYYNAGESSGGATPKFEQNSDGSFNYNKPLVQPEKLNDFEIGAVYNSNNLSVNLNLFYMIFNDEIVKNGKLDRFGQPTTGNVDKSLHRGVELSIKYSLKNKLEFFGNATYSNNKITSGKFFINATDAIDLQNNSISGFPNFLTNFGINYKVNNLFVQFNGKYVGKFYSDNYDDRLQFYLNKFPGFVDYNDNVNESYFTASILTSYEFNLFESLKASKIFFQVNNLFDNLYSANAIGKEFFPAADRSYYFGLTLGL